MRSRAQIKEKMLELDKEIEKLNKGEYEITGDEPVIQQKAALMWVVNDGE